MTQLQKHPEGRWSYEYSPYHSDQVGEIPAFEVFADDGKICDTNEDRPHDEQAAHACLIAAAPDLLDILESQSEAAQAVIDSWEKGDLAGAVTALAAWIAPARDAIAKATGGRS